MSPSELAPPGPREASRLRIGVLASQGDFAAHAEMLRSLGAEPIEVRSPRELRGLDGLVDVTARRNAFGRQIASFEAELQVEGLGPDPLRAVFIRAPWIEEHGPGVEVLASIEGHPVAVRQDGVLLCAFHPELTDDSRVHALLMALATAQRKRRLEQAASSRR